MKFIQAFSMALKSIFNNKMRSFLTMLGIIIGVGSVITLVSVMQGTQRKVLEEYAKMGTNRINVGYYDWNVDLTDDLYKYCISLKDEVLGVTPNTQQDLRCRYRTKNWTPTVYFGNDKFDVCLSYELDKGRTVSYSDVRNRVKICVIGSTIQKEFFGLENPIGKKIKISGHEFTVVGLYKEKSDSQQWSYDDIILVPQSLQRTLTGSRRVNQFIVKAASSETTKSAIHKIETFLKGKISDEWSYNVYSANEWIEQDTQMTTMLTLVVGGIAGISLLVGGIGIMNIMLVSVSERTREIGIRMAIGAPRRAIISQFLIEAATISACGGALGIGLGCLGSALLSAAIFQEIYLPSPVVAAGAVLFSVALGVFFGFYPANKASKMQPVDALRNQ